MTRVIDVGMDVHMEAQQKTGDAAVHAIVDRAFKRRFLGDPR